MSEDPDDEESPESGEGEAAEPEAEKEAEGAEKTETGSVEGDKKEGDPSNLQFAWEMLELAKMEDLNLCLDRQKVFFTFYGFILKVAVSLIK